MSGFRLLDASGQEIRVPVTKGTALIAYLLLSKRLTATRAEIAGLLWSEKTDAAARTALRQCLHQLRGHLARYDVDCLEVTQDRITLCAGLIQTDIDATLARGPAAYAGFSALEEGQILFGFEDLDPAFSEWLWEIRRITRKGLSDTLAAQLKAAIDTETRLAIAGALHQIDPALELAATPLIDRHIQTGNTMALLRVYKTLWDAMELEWDEEPSLALQNRVARARLTLGDALPAQSAQRLLERQKFLCVLAVKIHPTQDHAPARDRFLTAAHAMMTKAGGRILTQTGLDLCVLFGFPHATEATPSDTLNAALALMPLAGQMGSKVRLGIGVDHGMVRVPSDGAPPKMTGVLERAAHLAQRGHKAAIYTTAGMLHGGRHSFAATPQPEPIHGRKVLQVTGRARDHMMLTPQSRSRQRFVGRTPFLAALRAAWSEAESHREAGIVALSGAAGVGKSRLLREFLYDLTQDGVRVFTVRCNRPGHTAPRAVMVTLAQDLGVRVDAAGRAAPDVMGAALVERPTVLVFDDWHWADDATRHDLHDLIAGLGDAPVLIVIGTREQGLHDGIVRAAQLIQLPPMTAREVTQTAETLLQHPVDTGLGKKIFTKSNGYPLFVEEICHAITRGAATGLTLPAVQSFSASLQSLMSNRIETLPDNEARVAFAAAAHGETLNVPLLEQVLGHPLSDEMIARLCASDVLSGGAGNGELRFKHGVARDVIYRMIPDKERLALHRAYLDAISPEDETDQTGDKLAPMALHAREAGSYATAARLAEQAGDQALAASSLDLARRQFEIAMDMLDLLPASDKTRGRWLALVIKLAKPSVHAASHDHLALLERAYAIAVGFREGMAMAVLSYWLGYFQMVMGNYAEADGFLARAEVEAQSVTSEPMIFEAKAMRGCVLEALGKAAQGQAMCTLALEAKDRNPVQIGRAPVTSAYVRAVLGMSAADRGDQVASHSHFDAALSGIADFGHEVESSVQSMRAAVSLWHGDWQAARDIAKIARRSAERVSAPYQIGISRCIHSYAGWRMGGDPSDIDALRGMVHWLDAQGTRLYLTFAWGWLADALVGAGRLDEGSIAAERAIVQGQNGDTKGVAMAYRALAAAELARHPNQPDVAMSHLGAAQVVADARAAPHEVAKTALARAQVHIHSANPGAARADLAIAQPIFKRLGMDWFSGEAATLAAQLGGLDVRPARVTG